MPKLVLDTLRDGFLLVSLCKALRLERGLGSLILTKNVDVFVKYFIFYRAETLYHQLTCHKYVCPA